MSIDQFGFKAAAEKYLDGLTACREIDVAELRQLISQAYFNGCDDARDELSAALRGKPEPSRRFMNHIASRR